jgi:hypothetical protein
VAGHNDGDWIVMVRLAHRAKSLRTADSAGNLRIGARCSVRDSQQRLPAILLEFRSNQIKFSRELPQFAAKVSFELQYVWPQMFYRFNPGFIPAGRRHYTFEELDNPQTFLSRRKQQGPYY